MIEMNKVFLCGNLTRDPELRYLPSGAAVADLGLALNRRTTDRMSERLLISVCIRSCISRLPTAVASTGPAETGIARAFAVH